MITPTVSIVIPAYNHAGFLVEAIESVLKQDYAQIELIALDDGSTDNTREILSRYSGIFVWESHRNIGQAATLNKGWAMAKGDILGYLSADDVLRPGCVRAAVETFNAYPETILTYCDFELIDPSSRQIRTVRAADISYREMVVNFVCAPGPGVFFRRTAFESTGGWDASLRQMPDFDYWLRLGLCGKFRRIPRALAGFRVHEGSLTFSVTPERNAEEPVHIIERYFGVENVPTEIRQEQCRAVSNALLVSAQLHLRSGRYGAAFRNARRAGALFPANLFHRRILRQIANALFNRLAHRFLWLLKTYLKPDKQP